MNNEKNITFKKTVSGTDIATFQWYKGQLTQDTFLRVGVWDEYIEGNAFAATRALLTFNMPQLLCNPRIKEVKLKLYQFIGGATMPDISPKIGVYRVVDNLIDEKLIDFANREHPIDGKCYTFDITSLFNEVRENGLQQATLTLKYIDESIATNDSILFYSSSDTSGYAPEIEITYETNYSTNNSYRENTHEIGDFAQGSVDLQCGNLMLNFEDFAWSGNRMPVTIKHIYNSALGNYQYDQNSDIKLNTADFSAMKVGKGFRLNIMQSMMPIGFNCDGTDYSGYVYIGENGEETYFKPRMSENDEATTLYEDINDDQTVYDSANHILTIGSEQHLFDANGRLIKITDEYNNNMEITYTSDKITSVTDGAGRIFRFTYEDDFLTCITAPDGRKKKFTYDENGCLYQAKYKDQIVSHLTYTDSKLTNIWIIDFGTVSLPIAHIDYVYSGDKVSKIISEVYSTSGMNDRATVVNYNYSLAANRTVVEVTEPADDGITNTLKTVYCFNNDGEVVSEYMYHEEVGNVASESGTSCINPYSDGIGIVSNINNLLKGHNFENIGCWESVSEILGVEEIHPYNDEKISVYGKNYFSTYLSYGLGDKRYIRQITQLLPAGQYTFSACTNSDVVIGGEDIPPIVYLRVLDSQGNILTQSESYGETTASWISTSFELTSAQNVEVQIHFDGAGFMNVYAAQLENNATANEYNMLENGNFELDDDTSEVYAWECVNVENKSDISTSSDVMFNMTKSLCMNGELDSPCYAYQDIDVKSAVGTRETFTLSGWAKGYAISKHTRENLPLPKFELRAEVYYVDDTLSPDSFVAEFSPCTEDWQLASVEFSKKQFAEVAFIRIICDYSNNIGLAYFDDIQLIRNSIETNLVADDFKEEEESTADTEVDSTEEDTQTEGENGFSDLVDAYGNSLTETTYQDGEFGTIYRAFGFTPETDALGNTKLNAGNDLLSETDANGNTTEYIVDETTSKTKEIIDRCGNRTVYEYDQNGNVSKVISKNSLGKEIASVSYGYDVWGNLCEITRGDGQKYVVSNRSDGCINSIGIDGKEEKLIEYTYRQGTNRIKAITYANGDKMNAVYNGVGQLMAEKWYDKDNNLTAHYKYVYDGRGNIVRSIDIISLKEYNYSYENGKLIRANEYSITVDTNQNVTSKSPICKVLYIYDAEDTLVKKTTVFADGKRQTTSFEQTEDGAAITRFTVGEQTVTSHSNTDNFGRKLFDELQLGTGFVSRRFMYHQGEVTDKHMEENMLKSTPTTQLVSEIILSDGRTIYYDYDAEERITKITDSFEGVTEYIYDALGQLITEIKDGEVINRMSYDGYGNIIQKNDAEYVYDSLWKDKLISVGGEQIIYDAQGNPTTYLGNTLAWEKGRQLKSFGNITYTYNANGIRTSKTVDGIKHEYILDGAKILKETWGENSLIPLYDNEESICGIVYNDIPFYFLKNLQGDIIAITDKFGDTVARYAYDAWGKCTILENTSQSGAIASINPFRYRGYYYDKETELYYLQSRYYNPEVGRFVNGDEVLITFLIDASIKKNLFSYCDNNPIMNVDSYGFAPKGSEVPPASSGYVPPKGGAKKQKTKNGKTGWVDKNGNIWVPDPSNHGGDHWDVTGKNGYINVGRNGHAWGGKGKVTLPKAAKKQIEWGKIVRGIFVVLLVLVIVLIFAALIYLTGGTAAPVTLAFV